MASSLLVVKRLVSSSNGLLFKSLYRQVAHPTYSRLFCSNTDPEKDNNSDDNGERSSDDNDSVAGKFNPVLITSSLKKIQDEVNCIRNVLHKHYPAAATIDGTPRCEYVHHLKDSTIVTGDMDLWNSELTPCGLHLHMYMPGLGKKDVYVDVVRNTIHVSGGDMEEFFFQDYVPKFVGTVELPCNVYKIHRIKGKMKNGILKLFVPRNNKVGEEKEPASFRLKL